MPTSYTDIVDALDAAILAWAGSPLAVTIHGRTTQFRTMDDLLKARTYYAALAAQTTRSGAPFAISIAKPIAEGVITV